ncbi:MAG TPA: hypothetical protein VN213_07795, partial [Solirubrobacteraceae bacterium]|nr:hypothetical protein [Solirubrobacteraceae bacterium]
MTWWHEGLLLDGERLDARVEESLVSGEHIRSMSGTSTLTLTVHDPDRTLLTSGLLWAPRKRGRRARAPVSPDDRLGKTQLILSGDPYRLAGVRKDGHNLIATFEHEITALLREQTRPLVRSRESYTRAQFIRELVTRVKERRIAHLIFSADVRQPVERIQEPRRGVGRTEPVTIKGLRADAEQRRNIDLVLQVIEEEKAPEKAALALIEACIQEATFRNLAGGDRDSVGILQLRALHLGGSTSTRGGRRDVKLVARLFLTRGFWGRGGAIELARAHPNWTPGQIAQEVQGSGFPDAYEPHREEADAILQAGGGAGETITVAEEYIFRAGNLDGTREDYWDAIQRLAGEVDWRAFVTDNAF